MALFVAASDETSGADHRSDFFHCGWVAPEQDWLGLFAPLWDARVLKGPPRISYLHMTEIRSETWRKQQGIDRAEAEFRVDEAFGVICAVPSLTPISCSLNSGHLFDVFQKKFKASTGGAKRFEPDYLAFLGYAYVVLVFIKAKCPDADRVDFVVERKKEITTHIKDFYREMPEMLAALDKSELIPLLGELIPGNKDRVPLQAADLICWYKRRADSSTLGARDVNRYSRIASRNGVHHEWSRGEIETIYKGCLKQLNEENP